MNEFRIISPANEDIELLNTIPQNLQHYRLPCSHSLMASGSFGNMLFHHFKGDGFDIWYSNYLMKQSSKFMGCSVNAVLELHIPFVNDFETSWEGLKSNSFKSQQFEISYTPYVHTTAAFRGGEEYHTFDIHFTKELLQPYAAYCPKLSLFLEKVEKRKPANMLDIVQFLGLDMIRLINDMLNYKYREELAGLYFKNLVNELLVWLTSQVALITDEPAFSLAEQHQAIEVKKIILSDFELYHTVEQLARMAGTSECKLQMTFKHLFGTTVSKFSRKARLEEGYRLLTDTNYPLRVICEMVGYPDPANFSVAFRKQYGYWPGYIQKKIKR